MPKYYCDYCDIYLTHDSPHVRKSHNEGWKHKAAVRAYYEQFQEEMGSNLISNKVKDYEARMKALPFLPQSMGFGFGLGFGRGAPPTTNTGNSTPMGRGMPFFVPPAPTKSTSIPSFSSQH